MTIEINNKVQNNCNRLIEQHTTILVHLKFNTLHGFEILNQFHLYT